MAYSCDDLLSLGPAGGMFGMPVAMTPPAFGGRGLNYSVDSLLDFSKLHVEDARCVAIERYATKSSQATCPRALAYSGFTPYTL
jgi:hypothetical protein